MIYRLIVDEAAEALERHPFFEKLSSGFETLRADPKAWAEIDAALVVSADLLNEGPAWVVVVVPLTMAARGLPSHVELSAEHSGLDEVSYAKCEDVKSVSEQRLVNRLGSVDPAPLFEIARVLRFLLDLQSHFVKSRSNRLQRSSRHDRRGCAGVRTSVSG